uniref:Putative 30 kDa allergen-like protein n=1 Tax=Culex tarsalis TaxID=7177 RepID=B8RIS1_CULTA
MKFFGKTFLALSLLVGILCNAESTEETSSSTESNPESEPPTEDQPAESTENPSDSSSPSESTDDQSSKEPTADESSKPDDDSEASKEKPSKAGKAEATEASGNGSYSATYQEIGKILDSVDFKSIADLHLQRMLENAYQARVRNPIRDQTGQIADFSAIKSCFEKLAGEVKKLIDAAKKQFETCKTGGGTSSGCSDEQENPFADGVINLATTLQGCISSKRKN